MDAEHTPQVEGVEAVKLPRSVVTSVTKRLQRSSKISFDIGEEEDLCSMLTIVLSSVLPDIAPGLSITVRRVDDRCEVVVEQ